MSAGKDHHPKKLLDYTKQGKEMKQEFTSSQCHAAQSSSSAQSYPTSASIASKEELVTSSDRLQSTLDLLKRAGENSEKQTVDQVDFMLKIPAGFNSREPSDLRERFPSTPAKRRSKKGKTSIIESTLSDGSSERRTSRKSWPST